MNHTHPTRTVLVADSEPEAREALRRSLAGDGRRIVAVRDGLEALEFALEQRPDAIVLDESLSKLDGRGVLRALRLAPATREIPVLMISKPLALGPLVERLERALPGGPVH